MMLLSIYESKIPLELAKLWEIHIQAIEEQSDRPEPLPHEACAQFDRTFSIRQFLEFCGNRVAALEAASHIHRDGAPTASAPKPKVTGATGTPAQVSAQTPKPQKAGDGKKAKPKLAGTAANVGGTMALAGGTSVKNQVKKVDNKYDHHASGCIWCGASHDLRSCKVVDGQALNERWARIRGRQGAGETLCVRCLSSEHQAKECDKMCVVSGCDRRHHKLLHKD
jgi:hypothetical protein